MVNVKIVEKKFMDASTENTRMPAVAGTFYPGNKSALQSSLKKYFSNTEKVLFPSEIKALIVPHAGFIYSAHATAWGYRQLDKNKHIHFILIGPSHHSYFEGLASSGKQYWQTPLGRIKQEKIISRENSISILDKAHDPEHSIEVQLPFIQYRINDFSVSALLTGGNIDYKKTAEYLIDNYPDSTFIFSSDLSHYLPLTEAEKLDNRTINAILKNDREYFTQNENVACGAEGIKIFFQLAGKKAWKSKLIKYDTSYTASKDPNAVVGYTSMAFYE
jgi:MEMO1 family protein